MQVWSGPFISSLIATAYVILVLYELPLSVYAKSNGAPIPYLPPPSIDNVTSSEKSLLQQMVLLYK